MKSKILYWNSKKKLDWNALKKKMNLDKSWNRSFVKHKYTNR
jgi:hypothetical protein